MKPEVSIIVPVYKTEKFLSTCIDSIICQTFRNWELILVNDCSPDGSDNILAAYEKNDDRIMVVDHCVNRGVSQARFTGLENSAGKYVVFIDSDDWVPRNAIRTLYDKIDEEGSDIVTGSMVKVLDRYGIIRSKPRNSSTAMNRTESISTPELFDKYFINYFGVNLLPSYMCGKIYRRATLDKAPVRPVSFSMFEDMVFNLMLHPFLTKISFVTDTVYYYRFGGGTSSSTPHFLSAVKEQYLLKEEYIDRYNYDKATPYIKVELINCFYSHFANLVILDRLNYGTLGKLIREEIKDDFYNKGLFEGIEMSKKASALKSGNVTGIIEIIRRDVRKNRPKHLLKKAISRIIT